MKKIVTIFTVLLLVTAVTTAQENRREKRKTREKAKIEEVQQLFNNRTLQFLAQSAHPMGGGVIHLTSHYSLDIQDNKIKSYLPFYGVAYTAEYGSGEGGIKFEETASSSGWKSSKKGYELNIQVKTTKDVYQLYLFFSESGYGTLQVTCNNRQPIRFSGIVQALPKEGN